MRIGIIANPLRPLAPSVVPKLVDWLIQKKQTVILSEENKSLVPKYPGKLVKPNELRRLSDVVLAIGGDGTLLKAAHIVGNSEIPILGINLGRLGFLTEVALDELYSALDELLKSNYEVEHRMVLEGNLKKNKFYALNDIIITGTGSGRMLELVVYVDSMYVSCFSADGIIVATPTGSTAYSLAALGPILHPTMEAVIINLICPHTLGARPMVVSKDSKIKIECKSPNAMVVIDGQERMLLEAGAKLNVWKANYKINLIRSSARDFYKILRTKLKWGGGKER